jgi:IS605 OrfB family transposase
MNRKKKIEDTDASKQHFECTKAFQIIANEFCRIACQIHLPENAEFRNKKGNPDFVAMNKLVSRFRTKKEGLDNLPEFLYMKKTKSGYKAKRLHANRYMNDDGECYAYDILNNCSSRQLNSVHKRFTGSWFTKGKKVNHFYFENLAGLGWQKKICQRMPITPAHICDGSSISGDDYQLLINGEKIKKNDIVKISPDDLDNSNLLKSTLLSFGTIKSPLRLVLHRPFLGKLKTLEVINQDGELYACFTIEVSEDNKTSLMKKKDIKNKVGLDFGIKDHVIDDSGNAYNFLKDKKVEAKISELQVSLSRKKWGSNNYHKELKRINKLKTAQTRRHNYAIHNFTKSIVDQNDAIAIEDYEVLGIVEKTSSDKSLTNKQKANTNKKALEGGIYSIKTQLEYKSSLYGKHFKKVNPAYTTQDCSSCGYRNTELTLDDREWTCPECGEHHDRDQNASKNILKASGF